ncbi:hypothetical protein ANN_03697, partial [Periplaneta americana]
PELIAKYGYPVETHTVKTSDGYLLGVHRIPHGKGMDPSVKRPAILVQHGMMSSSADWVIMGPGTAFAYVLADAGYDVWLGNARGHTGSRAHATLDPDSADFWQFSWHEMGVHDLPAVIDYIIQETGEEKIFYAGHSMGTTMFYVMGSQLPEYNNKIRAMFSLAPIAFMSHMKSPLIQLLSDLGDAVQWLLELMGGFEFLPHSDLLSYIGGALCNDEALFADVCTNAIFLVCGFDSEQLDQVSHFRQYDHGSIKNLVVYGQLSPPDYDLSKVTAPVFLHYSDNDWLAAEVDVTELSQKLGNLKAMVKVPFAKFNHLDYLWAIDGPKLLYNTIIEEMKSY